MQFAGNTARLLVPQRALGELAARWEFRHDQHKLKVDGLGETAALLRRYGQPEDISLLPNIGEAL